MYNPEVSFRGGGLGGRPPPKEKEKRKKKREKRKKEKKREKERRQITTYKVLFFPIFNSPVALKNTKQFWPPKKKLK